jgi:hypothetical protein
VVRRRNPQRRRDWIAVAAWTRPTWRDAKPASVHHIGAAVRADAGAMSRTAAVGDRITVHGLHVGDATRCGEVLEVKGAGGEPPYVVRGGRA